MKSIIRNIGKAIMAVLMTASCVEASSQSMQQAGIVTKNDTVINTKKDWSTWHPSPKKALWLALLPGAGQIYNRKYWKLPIIYGGFVGCAYAIRWNDMMYDDYSQAYIDIMDDDPATQSYNQFLHLGNEITEENADRYANIFKRRKDYYRRYRDLSYIVLVGVYALQIIDAYIDASLSEFDISDNLTLNITPTIINSSTDKRPLAANALGIRCCITF